MLAKAATLPADEIVIDLEDAVAAEAKDSAREAVVAALARGELDGRLVAVRINALDTPWFEPDVMALAEAALATLVVPKVESAADTERVAGLLDRAGSATTASGRSTRRSSSRSTRRSLRPRRSSSARGRSWPRSTRRRDAGRWSSTAR